MSGPARQQRSVRLVGGLFGLLAVLLLAALIVLVQRSTGQRDAALQRTRHSYEVVLLTSRVEGSLFRAEAALGRFVIDGDRRTGTVYYDEWRNAGALIDRLATVIADDPVQAARLRTLQTLYERRGVELALPAARANYKQGWPALSLFARAGRSDTLPRISAILHEIAQAEGTLLDERSEAAAVRVDQSNDLTALLSVAGVLLAGTVIGLAWLVANTLAERRIARETAEIETDRAAALERAVAERTQELSEANARLLAEAATREEVEAKLRQVQKMDAVGQLTGGIAHDFNNMLAVVLGGIEMARRRVEEQAEEATRHLDSAMEGATRAAELTRRLLSFARSEPLLPTAIDPGQLLREITDLIDRTIGERIEVRILSDADVWPVWIDGYQLENAILNLAVNARDAMAGQGRIEMTTANVRLREGEIDPLPAGDYVRLSVSDNGSGMDKATLERVFEPFFTTKPVGQGTGLGLSQILGFARQSGGQVTIASTPGKGTTVSIYLPRHQGEVRRLVEPAGATKPGRATALDGPVLVVEDDPRVRAASGAALAELGYQAILCASGEAALAQIEAQPGIALLMTDVVMPAMTGPELVGQVRTQRPELPVLFVTGYVGEAGEAEGFRDAAVLRKPFTLKALGEALASVGGVKSERAA